MKALSPNVTRPAKAGLMRNDASRRADPLESVGHRLRAAYESTIREPLPVRLTDLVERLGERERSRGEG